jgi:hypothetical protein
MLAAGVIRHLPPRQPERFVNNLLCSEYGRINMARGPHAGKVSEGAMAASAIANVEITDSAGFAEYRKSVPASIAEFEGRFLTRGGVT